ncbi:MAG TPA: NnrU family protein [Steroidobacteraceae bacterium]|nr:NnrU family protein [Steroidobacteraceae bacterium]
MSLLILGLVLFLGVHSVSIFAPGWRSRIVTRTGELTWKVLYGVIAIVGFVLIVKGYGEARQSPVLLYQPPIGLRHLVALLMVPVFPMLLAAYLPGRIKATLKHPMLAAVKLWALAHLLANGTLADVVLFGSFLIWAVADRISFKYRDPRPIPSAPPSKINDVIAVVGGLAIYAFFVMWAHVRLFGVLPIPMGGG